MVRVGVQQAVPESLLQFLPSDGVQIVRIPEKGDETFDIDFWILPFGKTAAKATFARLRGVQVAQTISAGVDGIKAWLGHDITLCDAAGVHDVSTSEWVMSALLGVYKRLPLYRDLQREQQWKGQAQGPVFEDDDPQSNGIYRILGEDLNNKRVMIVGYGSIGRAIEHRLHAFGAETIRVARTPKPEQKVQAISEMESLLPEADAVVLIVPLTEQTKGMFGAKQMALMKKNAVLVNGARGPVVVTDDLVAALQSGHIRAALDVTDPEPLPEGHPLWTAPNLLLTPHIAGSTPEFIQRAFQFAGAQIRRYMIGEPLQNIVSESGY